MPQALRGGIDIWNVGALVNCLAYGQALTVPSVLTASKLRKTLKIWPNQTADSAPLKIQGTDRGTGSNRERNAVGIHSLWNMRTF